MTTETAAVMDYETAEQLEGAPSAVLVEESENAAPTGAVPAWLDGNGVWQYVAPSMESHYRENLGRTVRTVYVER